MRSTTGGQHSFAQSPRADIQRSAFNRSCGIKTTFDGGQLIPIFVDEALPGDTMSMSFTHFARLSTQLHPVMDNLWLDTFFFSVPNRLLWEHWEEFNGATIPDPDSTTDYTLPQVTVTCDTGKTGDYMGLPLNNAVTVSALPSRAYAKIWNDWFRDENLQDSEPVPVTDAGGNTQYGSVPLRRGKRHDYITSCLPWPQKGPSVLLPLGTSAPVVSTTAGIPDFDYRNQTNEPLRVAPSSADVIMGTTPDASGSGDLSWGTTTGLETNLSLATAATVNQLREAFQIQKLYERDARGGSRYTEILKSHFGVTSPDFRLQRAEYLGGGSSMINIGAVETTSENSGNVGDLGAQAKTAGSTSWTKSFVEHCTVIGLVSLRADLNYQESLNRMWSRQTRWDFFWPGLAHLGEQAVLNQEVEYTNTPGIAAGEDQGVFGYQGRYDEYRYKPSLITGLFRSNAVGSLDIWHLAQDFGGVVPVLDDAFIKDAPPIDRILAVITEPHMLFDGYFAFKHVRPMPTYGVPGLIDHF